MAVFFGGRLLTTPTTASVVDDSGLANQNISVGNVLAVIGRSSGGRPNAPLRFGSAQRAREVLRSGELLDAVLKAFDPSAQTGGPSEVIAIRVNPATQATLTLLSDASTPVINLTSTDFGLYTNQIKVKIENAAYLKRCEAATWYVKKGKRYVGSTGGMVTDRSRAKPFDFYKRPLLKQGQTYEMVEE